MRGGQNDFLFEGSPDDTQRISKARATSNVASTLILRPNCPESGGKCPISGGRLETQTVGVDEIRVGEKDEGDVVVEQAQQQRIRSPDPWWSVPPRLSRRRGIACGRPPRLERTKDGHGTLRWSLDARREVDAWEWRLEPGERYDASADPPGWRVTAVVVEGMLTIESPGGREQVTADGLLLDNTKDHAFVNEGTEPVRFFRCTSW